MPDTPFVVTVTADNFQQRIIEGSRERLVLVDFWADWCAPCRMLMPVLATLADSYRGKLLVAKINTEEEQALAAQFGIRSLPTVQLFKDGQMIDQFMGALPEAQIRQFLEPYLPRESDGLLSRVQASLNAGDLDEASRLLTQARDADPENDRIALLEAELAAAAGHADKAQAILDALPRELEDDPQTVRLKGRVRFTRLQANSPPESVLALRLVSDPKDSDARYRLAAHLVVRKDYEGALEQLLELMRRDRGFQEDAGRKGMLMVFAMLDEDDALVARYRNRMLNALY